MTVTVIVLDSVGLGALPDARQIQGRRALTLSTTPLRLAGVELPNLQKLGLGSIQGVASLAAAKVPLASYGRLNEVSPGKDTTTGHWEFMGVVLEQAFQTFPAEHPSFPEEVMDAFDEVTGTGHLGNRAASGTVIIEELGEEHLETGKPVVYTSADSVFQIAAHIDVVDLDTLYEWCEGARDILTGDYAVARVIARPFEGEPGEFDRIGAKRKDFSLSPPETTVLNVLKEAGKEVVGVGKIPDIYGHEGFTREVKTGSNLDGIAETLEAMRQRPDGLVFCNLVEFDSLYGHRRDPGGYAGALKDFDERLPELLDAVTGDDLLILTSDHGNDPTWEGSDHTREYGLLLAYRSGREGKSLGTRDTFADLGATVADVLGVTWEGAGSSFATELD